ncbi:3-keto-5-aminohexanoate cleavage protein [Cupriavidus oxalaticus]|uniref:3-keto-5-aminohexanoate cleavage protein n=1 Tax=Cupriavidus oxalaticus TaxID=96344 RepID=A0A375GML2_9BURK|nr:3-keto-5-aminohexanoate cleavage protein [Cupriavidus oxalaticus]QRQ85199.1 3-keto-5-aminohexanoate cleavage protein [Cupriavidus oxalaticus]QRQ90713.1 3-keto-5-aminohexanoate cleavage protein [Cupriavidus oxalaticus]WQD85240.1 3-keto-5-aminohexanoate cleavage protein [Cupriavidus oxalaticus]SPC23446.1 NADPH dependend quinone reductase [Cupriavidus oxalaticus]
MHARKTIITCAVTGNIVTPEQHPGLPVTPAQIADAALEAAEAGAAAAHIHVRDPETGRPSMALEYYADVIDRIRTRHRTLIINLTTGPGGRFVPSEDEPRVAAPGTTLLPPGKRVEHITALRPDVCSLDLNTMNSGGDVVINTPANVRKMAAAIRAAGVMPELEIFDSGDLNMALDFIRDGVLDGPGLWTFVLGVKYGFAPTPETIFYARNMLPPGAHWSAFGIGRAEFPIVAQAWLAGGHVRVGLEDNIYLEKGVLAPSNAALVAKARDIVRSLGGEIASPVEARRTLGLREA